MRPGLPILWVRVKKSQRRLQQSHQVVAAKFEIVLDDYSLHNAAITTAFGAIQRPPLSKFGVDADLVALDSKCAAVAGYWYPSGRFWNAPVKKRPLNGEPHVVSRFKPDPDRVDDTPYA